MTLDAANRAKRIAYVTRALQLDPTRHSDAILAARTAALGLASSESRAPTVDFQENRRHRQQATANLGNLRNNFWQLPEQQLRAELDQIAALDFTELAATIQRLQTVAQHRREFLDLAQNNQTTPAFVSLLKEILVFSPRETAGHKETVRQAMRRPLWRRSPRQLLMLLSTELPDFYRVEEHWFDSLLRQRMSLFVKPSRTSTPKRKNSVLVPKSAAARPSERSSNWWIWIVIVIAANALRAIFSSHE